MEQVLDEIIKCQLTPPEAFTLLKLVSQKLINKLIFSANS